MKRCNLGAFEEIVILTIGILQKEAYGVAIMNGIETHLYRTVSMGVLHTALLRHKKDYVESSLGGSTEEGMGRRESISASQRPEKGHGVRERNQR
ncbi:MAG: hypothetical protein HC859_17605 [Bacteroidia bacterium]|nr:hypothetical protein [Bacteroidia bacterium]